MTSKGPLPITVTFTTLATTTMITRSPPLPPHPLSLYPPPCSPRGWLHTVVMDAESRKEAAQAAILAAVNDDSRSNAILIVTAVFFAISFVSVCLRLFVRTRVVRAFGWDDTTMVLAMVGLSSCDPRSRYFMSAHWLYTIR